MMGDTVRCACDSVCVSVLGIVCWLADCSFVCLFVLEFLLMLQLLLLLSLEVRVQLSLLWTVIINIILYRSVMMSGYGS